MTIKSIKIVSNGSPFGTRVLDAQTGEEIPGVRTVTIDKITGRDVVCATVEFIGVQLEVIAEVQAVVADG